MRVFLCVFIAAALAGVAGVFLDEYVLPFDFAIVAAFLIGWPLGVTAVMVGVRWHERAKRDH